MIKIKKCPLTKRIPRDFNTNIAKYIGIICILVCTISIGSSFQSVLDGAVTYLDDIKSENYQEDGFFETLEPINDKTKEYFDEKDIQVSENYYVTETEYNQDCKVLIFDERDKIDIPVLFEGNLPKADNEIALDHVFASHKEIVPGDKITLKGKKLIVCGTVSLPDYSALFMNNTDLVMNTSHFCVSVVTRECFEQFDEGNITYRYSYRNYPRETVLR